MKMLHFSKYSGVSPRPFNSYDAACERLYRAYMASGPAARGAQLAAEKELRTVHGADSGDLDSDYTHGRNIVRKYRVVEA